MFFELKKPNYKMTSLCSGFKYLLVLLLMSVKVQSRNKTVEERIRMDSDLTEFYKLLENNQVANASLNFRSLTVFAPTNQAFQRKSEFQELIKEKRPDISVFLVNYHMVTLPYTTDQLSNGQSIPTDYEGNPPLWITKVNSDEIYVNNARILQTKLGYRDYVAYNNNHNRQVLHIINEVLEPVVSASVGTPIYNPDAYQFLNQSESIGLGNHRLRTFRQRVSVTGKGNIFQTPGPFTFFIPVDEGFTPPPRSDKIDAKVIDGHVVPGYVLFTAPTPPGQEFKTLAFSDMMKVVVSFQRENDGKNSKIYVKSNTVLGDSVHPNGVVLAEIIRANIPVKNGVVHLINRPLMVVDSTVTQFLKSFEDRKDGPVHEFYKKILDAGGDFLNRINQLKEMTLFAPSNAAWNQTYLDKVINDDIKLREVLDYHLVAQKLPIDVIINNNAKELYLAPTYGGKHHLYFNVLQGAGSNRTLTVEGGGVNATVVTANIAALNGVVHIIDRVLGVPYTDIKTKLETDPMLNKTRFLGERTKFNDRLANRGKKFTYFVPRDYAWTKTEVMIPSAHKKLFMPQFVYHVEQMLERHLVVSDRVYTMADLKEMSEKTFTTLPTYRDSLKIRVKEVADKGGHSFDGSSHFSVPRKGYAIEWRGETIPVFRPDVYCTNGIIHVIDRVLLQESDVQINGEPTLSSLTVTTQFCLVLIAKFYLN